MSFKMMLSLSFHSIPIYLCPNHYHTLFQFIIFSYLLHSITMEITLLVHTKFLLNKTITFYMAIHHLIFLAFSLLCSASSPSLFRNSIQHKVYIYVSMYVYIYMKELSQNLVKIHFKKV